MAQTNGTKNETHKDKLPSVADAQEVVVLQDDSDSVKDSQDIDEILSSLKTLLSTVEKLQKIRTEEVCRDYWECDSCADQG
ncbi:hypothetical protein [Calothrix sp. 336/3]|uniref:hypothetical protein n=1 Tax=Calothrix sp. 336/3 TaxID=1337936 RepID=UPI00069AFD02|nr:hypothetical protein [Calothrix sp. 336/3]